MRTIPRQARSLPAPRRRVTLGLVLVVLVTVLHYLARNGSGYAITTTALGQPLGSNAMVVDSSTHHVFVATMAMSSTAPPTSSINMLDSRSGTLLAAKTVGTNLLPLALDERLDHVVVASSTAANGGVVRLLDGRTDAIVRSVGIPLPPISMAVSAQAERIYVASGNRSNCLGISCPSLPTVVSVFDARTLRLLHTVYLDRSYGDLYVDEQRGRIFVPTSAGLAVLDASSGRLRMLLPGRTVLALDQMTGNIMVTASDGAAMLDMATGRVLWRRQELLAGAAVDARTGNVLILPVGTNTIEVLSGAGGQMLRAVEVGNLPVSIAVDSRRGRAYVVNHDDSTLSVLDTRNWRVQHTQSVGPYPMAVMLDLAADRAIVESASASVPRRQDTWAWLPSGIRRWLPFLPGLPVRTTSAVTSSSVSVLDLSRLR